MITGHADHSGEHGPMITGHADHSGEHGPMITGPVMSSRSRAITMKIRYKAAPQPQRHQSTYAHTTSDEPHNPFPCVCVCLRA
jgi:hypothetical protein